MPTDPENLLKTTDSEQLPDDNPFHWGGDAADGEDQEKGGDDSIKAVNAEIRRVFDLYDTSKDGLLSREEFLAAVTLRLREGEVHKHNPSSKHLPQNGIISESTCPFLPRPA